MKLRENIRIDRHHFNWGPGLFLIFFQSALLIGLPFYFSATFPSGALIAVSLLLLHLTGLSITAGYHRFYSHRSFRAHPAVEILLLFFGAMAGQGSVLRWAFEHRLHHAHTDTDKDPYSIKKGFWYAHFLWILEKPKEIEPKIVPDLMKNRWVMFQHRHIVSLMILSNLLAFICVGFWLGDYLGSLVIACALRLFLLHHFTWFINSLAHTFGDKPFCQEQSAVNNCIVAFLTFGEGYHNFHHTFANDYRNGIRWFHYDPTKWLIWSLHQLGLATHLKQVDSYSIRKRMVMERKELLHERICSLWYVKKEELEKRVSELSDSIVEKIAELNRLKAHYRQLRKNKLEPEIVQSVKRELSLLKKSLKRDWKAWVQLSRNILRLKDELIPSAAHAQ